MTMNVLYGILLLCTLCAFASTSQAQDFNLDSYRWENRILVVFAEQENSLAYQALAQDIADLREEFIDRDMVLISVFEKDTSTAEGHPLSLNAANQLRKQFKIDQGAFRVYLIGKDGGIKREGADEIRIQNVFALIDTMPMRRSEMRRKSSDQN